MLYRRVFILLSVALIAGLSSWAKGVPVANRAFGELPAPEGDSVTIATSKITLVVDYEHTASIHSLVVNGQKVISSADGIFTSIKVGGNTYSSLHLKSLPLLDKKGHVVTISGIVYGDDQLTVSEKWVFTIIGQAIKWNIERSLSKAVEVQETSLPVFNFDDINTWEGAYQGYGGLAWFYLFNEKLCTYGVHTSSSNFWNSKSGNGLNVAVDAPGEKVAMKYTRAADNRLAYAITVSDKDMVPQFDSGTWRRRFIRERTDVWGPFAAAAGIHSQSVTLSYFDFNEKYGRGTFAGVNGSQVSSVLNTIARIGVIDSLHFGGNSWHTPYGPICLHEQYIAQMGLGIDDPAYLKGYESCLDYYCAHAIKPDGRVFPRWAYTNEDMMPGQGNKDGFYEAQWGILMDSNPDLVTNISDLYNMTGDKDWVSRHRLSCEAALDFMLRRDSDGNGLVEMMTDSYKQKRSSDWIDIIWASYENAFVNAKLYHALVEWSGIERQLHNNAKADVYEQFATKLKISFNKPVGEGGFWDEENQCYVHWIDKDKSIHGRNMVTPVNFMAIAYGICDDDVRRKKILDKIEAQMEQEKLFFWPLAMTSYAPGEGKEYQYPFPSYENGDLFLSWGSIGVAAYASYDPALALKYVKNVLNQYSKDGLAFQRYGRVKQDGLGDDILSGNSLSIVGLYQAIYGVNPLYNRFYLDPHLAPELYGTRLRYRFRGQELTIGLDSNRYSVSNRTFKLVSPEKFGFASRGNRLSYFKGSSPAPAMDVIFSNPLELDIEQWTAKKMNWVQTIGKPSVTRLAYTVHLLKPETAYTLSVDGKSPMNIRSDKEGNLVIQLPGATKVEHITISHED